MDQSPQRLPEPADAGRLTTVAPEATATTSAAARRPIFGRMFGSLGNHDIRYIFLAGFGSMGAFQMQTVAIGYVAFQITGKATTLGAVNLATGVSQTIALLFTSAMIDRLPRRRTLLVTQTALGVIAFLNFLLVLAQIITVEQFVAVAFTQGAVFALNGPSRQAFLSAIVRSNEELHNSIALLTASMTFTRIVGPAIAGLILSLPGIGAPAAFGVIASCYLWSINCITRLRNRGEAAPRKSSAIYADLLEGWRYIARTPILLSLLTLMAVGTLLGTPYLTMMAVFAEREFAVGAVGLGALLSITGIGALSGALLMAYLSDSPRKGRIQLIVGLVYGLGIAGFALSPNLWIALPFLLLSGAGGSMLFAVNSALFMSHAAPGMTGRIAAAQSLSFALSPMGVFPASALADAIGSRPTIAGCGLLLALAVLGLSLFIPALRRLR